MSAVLVLLMVVVFLVLALSVVLFLARLLRKEADRVRAARAAAAEQRAEPAAAEQRAEPAPDDTEPTALVEMPKP